MNATGEKEQCRRSVKTDCGVKWDFVSNVYMANCIIGCIASLKCVAAKIPDKTLLVVRLVGLLTRRVCREI